MSQFQTEDVLPLLEFGDRLENLGADLYIFMARKALCLYDLFLTLGCRPIEKPIVSDRLLDMDMTELKGKKIALVDDTLIVGTTLAKTVRRLQGEVGAAPTTHVFAIDKDWWCRDLVEPDTFSLAMPDRRLMSFCTSEVRALSLLPRPYLVDFPRLTGLRLSEREVDSFLGILPWSGHSVATDLQLRNNTTALTFLPGDVVTERITQWLGPKLPDCLGIYKVRLFSREIERKHWLQIVPVVTLLPLATVDVNKLFEYLMDQAELLAGEDVATLAAACLTASSKLRLSQYVLSIALGNLFINDLGKAIGREIQCDFSLEDACRLFGPWHRQDLAKIHQAGQQIWMQTQACAFRSNEAAPAIPVAELPKVAATYGLENVTSSRCESDADGKVEEVTPAVFKSNILIYLAERFAELFNAREIPARKEALRLGQKILDPERGDAPNRDRLEVGIPWPALVNHFIGTFGLERKDISERLLSLALDATIDLGISVPIISEVDGVVFRAYRHGEDARFGDEELALAQELMRGALKAAEVKGLPSLVTEKLLVLLLKIGTSKQFLEPVYGKNGSAGVARIGFELMGPVPMLRQGPTYLADRNLWLSDYLIERRVFKKWREKGATLFAIGRDIEGNYPKPDAPDQAYELGTLVGLLIRTDLTARNDELRVLRGQDLVVLATCWPPRHMAAALQAELEIFKRWFASDGQEVFRKKKTWSDAGVLRMLYSLLVSGKGAAALHQARFKYKAYRGNQHAKLVESSSKALAKRDPTGLHERRWRSYWTGPEDTELNREQEIFSPLIERAAILLWELGVLEISAELAVAAAHFRLLPGSKESATMLGKALDKLEHYSSGLEESQLKDAGSLRRLTERMGELIPILARALEGEGLSAQFKLFQDWEADFVPEQAFGYCSRQLVKRLRRVQSLASEINVTYEQWNEKRDRKYFRYMIWYDIIDSKGQRAGKMGQDIEAYRESVKTFKRLVNERLKDFAVMARRSRVEVHVFRGGLGSHDDGKHIFLKGTYCSRKVPDIVELLVHTAAAAHPVQLRICAIECDFANSRAYLRGFDPEVYGERFWEHWYVIVDELRDLESVNQGDSFLAIGGRKLLKDVSLSDAVTWFEQEKATVPSEVAGLGLRTSVVYGRVRQSKLVSGE